MITVIVCIAVHDITSSYKNYVYQSVMTNAKISDVGDIELIPNTTVPD